MRGEHEVHEAGRLDEGAKLSFQESTGNSAGPERNVLFGTIRDRLADDDVGDLQTPAGLEDAEGLASTAALSGQRLITPLEMTTSTLSSATGSASRSPSRNSMFV